MLSSCIWCKICINDTKYALIWRTPFIMNNDIWKCKFVNIEHRSVPGTNFQHWNCHTITNLIHIRITFLCLYWLQWKYAKLCKSNIFISVQNFAAALIQTTAACHSQYWSWYMLATTRVRLTMYRIQNPVTLPLAVLGSWKFSSGAVQLWLCLQINILFYKFFKWLM